MSFIQIIRWAAHLFHVFDMFGVFVRGGCVKGAMASKDDGNRCRTRAAAPDDGVAQAVTLAHYPPPLLNQLKEEEEEENKTGEAQAHTQATKRERKELW
jgi:hypothetical protein